MAAYRVRRTYRYKTELVPGSAFVAAELSGSHEALRNALICRASVYERVSCKNIADELIGNVPLPDNGQLGSYSRSEVGF